LLRSLDPVASEFRPVASEFRPVASEFRPVASEFRPVASEFNPVSESDSNAAPCHFLAGGRPRFYAEAQVFLSVS